MIDLKMVSSWYRFLGDLKVRLERKSGLPSREDIFDTKEPDDEQHPGIPVRTENPT
jgi:hypothetical protein